MDHLHAMTVFVAVAEARGFAVAARKLGLSPPAVTRVIAAFESHLDARLLQRTTRSVALTEAGRRYLERAKRILADVAEAEAAAKAERAVPTGRLVVTAPVVFGRLHVAPLMTRYLARHRGVQVELLLNDRAVSLVDEGVDVGFRIGPLDDSTLVARLVGSVRRVAVAAPSYLTKNTPPRHPTDLRRHDLIHLTSLAPTADWRFVEGGKELRVAVGTRFRTNSADAALEQALAGGGVTLALSYQVEASVRAGALRVVLPQFEPPPSPIHLVYPSTRLLSAKVRALYDCVTETCSWNFTRLARDGR